MLKMDGKMNKAFIRHQFNRQAEQFANFKMTRSETIFRFIHDFCEFKSDDRLLDVACGSGAFVNYCAKRLKAAVGADLSDELIRLAKRDQNSQVSEASLFLCGDVEYLPFPDNSFSLVTCRSALHHMEKPHRVLKEMKRVVSDDGKVCIQDMTSFSDPVADAYFEKMEKLVDQSHHRTLRPSEIKQLLISQDLQIENIFETTLTHNFFEYVGHALQNEAQLDALSELIRIGISDPVISPFLFEKDEILQFKRSGVVCYASF